MTKNHEYGFTLIEMMITVAIIGILASIAIVQVSQYRINSYNASALSDTKNLLEFEMAFEQEYDEWAPVSLADQTADGRIIANVLLQNGNTAVFRIDALNKDVFLLCKTDNTHHYAIVAAKHGGGDHIFANDMDAFGFRKKAKAGPMVPSDIPAATAANDLTTWALM